LRGQRASLVDVGYNIIFPLRGQLGLLEGAAGVGLGDALDQVDGPMEILLVLAASVLARNVGKDSDRVRNFLVGWGLDKVLRVDGRLLYF